MSCTRTNMSARHIWGFDRGDQEMRLARQAGWRRADLTWERVMEAANEAWCTGQGARARRLFAVAHLIARARFARGDPRRATAPAALAMVHARQGNPAKALKLQNQALAAWAGVEDFISDLEIKPRSRSSLFHMRMEVRHRDTFHQNLRTRYLAFAGETRQSIEGIGKGAAGHRHFSRWRGEKPNPFDDTRKLLAACLLMPDAAEG